mmetsp:Transcript_27992/g.80237  ORF Transcript_27992/g.80237 Transcript_27992/m.80237 type:complete len:277 (-) Transcript_27992:1383-2213(-)
MLLHDYGILAARMRAALGDMPVLLYNIEKRKAAGSRISNKRTSKGNCSRIALCEHRPEEETTCRHHHPHGSRLPQTDNSKLHRWGPPPVNLQQRGAAVASGSLDVGDGFLEHVPVAQHQTEFLEDCPVLFQNPLHTLVPHAYHQRCRGSDAQDMHTWSNVGARAQIHRLTHEAPRRGRTHQTQVRVLLGQVGRHQKLDVTQLVDGHNVGGLIWHASVAAAMEADNGAERCRPLVLAPLAVVGVLQHGDHGPGPCHDAADAAGPLAHDLHPLLLGHV